MKRLLIPLLTLLLTACGGGDMDDLKQFVADSGKDMQGKIEPLPQVRPYEPFSYNAFDLPDPFKPRKLAIGNGGGGLQPDPDRPKEPLEAYSLETLKMVGVLAQKGQMQVVIQAPDKAVYHLHKGNYLGQNFGMITQITDNSVTLREIVQDSGGDWSERTSTLTLQE
jgi:type IV pilus assembly protein PilP